MPTLRPIDVFFLEKEEPVKSCLLFLRGFIPKQDKRITEEWKYGLPFYYLNGKMFCYLWIHKKYRQPYIGLAEGNKINHPDLLQEKRARMRILLIDPSKDIPVKKIKSILKEAIALYK
ncbi:MAG: DUF1801 domain-containing protein [Terrimonas sp.]|uniref:DUF1801 domain-containing protein n=1 Tax=Terrimonas sp. TaxID=1914338 RepID=UPI00092930F4|nr:DUF1801 domain-containing protein [Terrimonas sp.]MBN8789862.1 DUF1801 domain-containing protein [Terrimonas sp.]OJY89479.1 MAG: hypothetical protein BGP13_03260 [Sphingobacteriales bacterium 40-81]PVD50492.1 hypothetical protein DC498_19745 [Terrimonas sp.]